MNNQATHSTVHERDQGYSWVLVGADKQPTGKRIRSPVASRRTQSSKKQRPPAVNSLTTASSQLQQKQDSTRATTNRQGYGMVAAQPKDSFDGEQSLSVKQSLQKPKVLSFAQPQLTLQNATHHTAATLVEHWQSPQNLKTNSHKAKKIKNNSNAFIQAHNMSPLASSISGKGFNKQANDQAAAVAKSVSHRLQQEEPRRFNETQVISYKPPVTQISQTKTTKVTKIKKRLVKLSTQQDNSQIKLGDSQRLQIRHEPIQVAAVSSSQNNSNRKKYSHEIRTGVSINKKKQAKHYNIPSQPEMIQTAAGPYPYYEYDNTSLQMDSQLEGSISGLNAGRRSIQISEDLKQDSHSNSLNGLNKAAQKARNKHKSGEKVKVEMRGGKDLLTLVKPCDFNNTVSFSNQRVLPVSTKNQSNKSLLKKLQQPQTTQKVEAQQSSMEPTPLKTREDCSSSRRLSQLTSKLSKIKTYQSQATKPISKVQSRGERPPVTIRLQLQDINQPGGMFSPLNLGTCKAEEDHDMGQSFSKAKSKKYSVQPLKTQTSDRASSNLVIGMRRGQQSTTNKNAKPMVQVQPTNRVCSATNKVKKTFSFDIAADDILQPTTTLQTPFLKTYLMQQLLLNQSQVQKQNQQLQHLLSKQTNQQTGSNNALHHMLIQSIDGKETSSKNQTSVGSTTVTTQGGNTVININIGANQMQENKLQSDLQSQASHMRYLERWDSKQEVNLTQFSSMIKRNFKLVNKPQAQTATSGSQYKLDIKQFKRTQIQQHLPDNKRESYVEVVPQQMLSNRTQDAGPLSSSGVVQVSQQQRQSMTEAEIQQKASQHPQSNYQGHSPPNQAPIHYYLPPSTQATPKVQLQQNQQPKEQVKPILEPTQQSIPDPVEPDTTEALEAPRGNASQSQDPQPKPEEPTPKFPMSVRQCLKAFSKSGKMTDYEKTEVLDYEQIYFIGTISGDCKIQGRPGKNYNYGYDDEQGDYTVVLGDHLAFRFEVMDFLGKGSFGQAIKCLDHKTGEIVAVKIIRNKEKFKHQATVELNIVTHLTERDPYDQNNIIRSKDSCYFRQHLIISFELFSINLYEFIKGNNFQGVSLSLIRRFAIQILQALRFLEEENIIHCDLKPENILLKSQDKSGIKLIDFGSSCFADQRIYTYIQSRFYRAPEIILGIPFTTAIDMWSLGCILIELYTGMPIFPGESEHQQLMLLMEVIGLPDPYILERSSRRANFFEENSNQLAYDVEDSQGQLRIPGTKPLIDLIGDESESFLDFINQILVWDPETRISPLDALQHPWIVEGLPKRVLIHHQRMLGLNVPSSDCSSNNFDAEVSQSRLQADVDQQDSISRPVNQLEDIDLDEIDIDDEDNYGQLNEEVQMSHTQPLKLKQLGKKLAPELTTQPLFYQKPVPLDSIEKQMSKTVNMAKQLKQINLKAETHNYNDSKQFGYLLNSKPAVIQSKQDTKYNNYV